MATQENIAIEYPGIYLFIEFDWPDNFTKENAEAASKLHLVTSSDEYDWIQEVIAASGGIGGGGSSIWVFWLENYAALDKLFNEKGHPVCESYNTFFREMKNVKDFIREKVLFV